MTIKIEDYLRTRDELDVAGFEPMVVASAIDTGSLPVINGNVWGDVSARTRAALAKKLEVFDIRLCVKYGHMNTWLYLGERGVIEITGRSDEMKFRYIVDQDVYKQVIQPIKRRIKPVKPDESEQAPLYVINGSGGELHIERIAPIGVEFNPANYTLDVAVDFKHVTETINSGNPHGRLTIVSGPPGTGKTFFLRALMQACPRRKFVLMTSSMFASISATSIVSMLIDHMDTYDDQFTLLLEDADRYLAPRHLDNEQYVSTLLNATDGMLGEALDLHVVATTNLPTKEIDPALTRTGRLLEHVTIAKLPSEVARARIEALTGKSFKDSLPTSISLSDVYHLALERGYVPPPTRSKADVRDWRRGAMRCHRRKRRG